MTDWLPDSLFIANRGEIARRIGRTARDLGVRTIVAHSHGDSALPFVLEAEEAVCLDGLREGDAYLDIERLVSAALSADAEAVHPGYGFLSERAEFAEAVTAAGLRWVGPGPDAISLMGDKIQSRRRVEAAGVPVSGGSGHELDTLGDAQEEAARIGYPVMLKASAGGGGMGMAIAQDATQLGKTFEAVRNRAERLFGSGRVFVERFVERARHIEVQVLGLADGTVVALGHRDCSTQRRNQKIVEESPAPYLPDEVAIAMREAALACASSVDYRNAGTVEFLFDAEMGDFFFLEMNTRLQVEHPVTEMVFGIDLVHEQLRVAMGGPPTSDLTQLEPHGHAIEARICAEDSVRFLPSPGVISRWDEPSAPGIRVDSGYAAGNRVTPSFDPLLAKLCVHAETRGDAVALLGEALDTFIVEGPRTNLEFHRKLVRDSRFVEGRYDTGIIPAVQAG